MQPEPTTLDSAFREERRTLLGLCYRMTGSAADAEDVVQETFVRALARPPEETDRPWGPWLTRVALNLSRDRLRARKRREYVGPWLPEALETPLDATRSLRHGEARYGELESVTIAFLVALEALRSSQRAVLVLRDVLDCSVAETAETLGMSESNVKVTLHRARAKMAAYDARRVVPDAALEGRTAEALQRFLGYLAADDVEGLSAMLRDDVRVVNDGGGEFFAARRIVVGRDRCIAFHRGVRRDEPPLAYRIATINGLPSFVALYTSDKPKLASRFVFQLELDETGLVREVRVVLASTKLRAVAFPDPPRGP